MRATRFFSIRFTTIRPMTMAIALVTPGRRVLRRVSSKSVSTIQKRPLSPRWVMKIMMLSSMPPRRLFCIQSSIALSKLNIASMCYLLSYFV